MRDFLETIFSYAIALLRLIFITAITFLGGLHMILFNSVEVCNVMMYSLPLRKDRKNLAYIDKLNMSNIDLMQPPNFIPDEDFGEDEGLQGEE